MTNLTTALAPVNADDALDLHPTVTDADLAAEAAYFAALADADAAADAMLDAIDWDAMAEESAWMDSYERGVAVGL